MVFDRKSIPIVAWQVAWKAFKEMEDGGCLEAMGHTWYVLSNLSYMNRVMMLVFPTDWSPRNT